MNDEDDLPKKRSYELGENLENFSIDDIDAYLSAIEKEILRVENIKKEKLKALNIAKNFFKD